MLFNDPVKDRVDIHKEYLELIENFLKLSSRVNLSELPPEVSKIVTSITINQIQVSSLSKLIIEKLKEIDQLSDEDRKIALKALGLRKGFFRA